VVVSPFGVFGGRRRGWGYDQPYDPRLDPRFDPRYRRGYGRQNSGCLRDLLLLEGGCCLAEALGGNCLLRIGWLLPTLLQAFTVPGGGRGSRSQRALLTAIASYRRNISARRSKPVCRYTPSCSAYAAEAITRYGAVTGSWRAAGRLLRCRPGTAGGFDPVDAPEPCGRPHCGPEDPDRGGRVLRRHDQ
jgi:putative membrane protein insertion efficiency factor